MGTGFGFTKKLAMSAEYSYNHTQKHVQELDFELHWWPRSKKCYWFHGCVRQEGRVLATALTQPPVSVASDTVRVFFQLYSGVVIQF